MRRTVPPSAEIEARIEHMLSVGVGENPRESLSELARLGARLIIQRAVEDEFDAWLGRARYERRPSGQHEERSEESGLRNGFRPRRVQTAEGELQIEIPQVRQAAETFASKLFPRTPKLLRTEPLKALVIGAFSPVRPAGLPLWFLGNRQGVEAGALHLPALEKLAIQADRRARRARQHAAYARELARVSAAHGDHGAERVHLRQAHAHEGAARVTEQTAGLYGDRVKHLTRARRTA